MTRVSRLGCAMAVVLTAHAAAAAAQGSSSAKYAGRLLADVLSELHTHDDLNIVFSSELVRPEMRVASEPKSTAPRKLVDELLRPHGLEVRSGPGDALMVVRSRRSPKPAAPSGAPTGRIKGRIVDARTATPLPRVVIAVIGMARETTSDADGSFAMSDLPAGSVSLYVALVGYGLARPTVQVPEHGTADIVIALADGTGTYTEAVTVVGDAFRGTPSNVPVQHALNSAEISDLRGVLTDDPFRAIQALPAVSTGNDFRSEFSIRGSDFRHIGLSIDGMATPWPVHAIRDTRTSASIAMLNGDIIDALTVTAGAAPQQRAGRTGAWIDFTIREGSRARTEAHGAVSATSASLVSEGPLGASKHGSWLVSIRQSYLQWLLKRLDYDAVAFGFTDAQSKIVYDVTPRQQFQLTLIGGRSKFDQQDDDPGLSSLGIGTGSSGLALAGWRSTIGSSVVLTQRLAGMNARFDNQGTLTPDLGHSVASDLSYRADATWTPRSSLLVQAGTYLQRQRETTTINRFLETRAGTSTARRTESVAGSAWMRSGNARAVWTGPRGLSFDTGVRAAHSTLTDRVTATPWLLGEWPVAPSWSVRAGAALVAQEPDLEHVVGTFGRSDVRAERARDLDAAIEHRPTANVRWQIAMYDRRERDVLRLEDAENRMVDGRLVFSSSLTPSWRNALTGSARGVELLVQRRDPARLNGWIGYAYARTRYDDTATGESYWADFDQRHTLSAYGQYRLSPRTSVGAKLRYGSNFPIAGYFEQRPSGLFAGDRRNAVRLAPYSRLDVRADHAFNYSSRRLTLFVEVINVFNRTNSALANGVVIVTSRAFEYTNTMFPLLPSAGVRIDF